MSPEMNPKIDSKLTPEMTLTTKPNASTPRGGTQLPPLVE